MVLKSLRTLPGSGGTLRKQRSDCIRFHHRFFSAHDQCCHAINGHLQSHLKATSLTAKHVGLLPVICEQSNSIDQKNKNVFMCIVLLFRSLKSSLTKWRQRNALACQTDALRKDFAAWEMCYKKMIDGSHTSRMIEDAFLGASLCNTTVRHRVKVFSTSSVPCAVGTWRWLDGLSCGVFAGCQPIRLASSLSALPAFPKSTSNLFGA